MFLLSKLDSVSRVFPNDVKVTREFLLDRGIPAGSLQALTHFSARLAIDPSFQRDITSLAQAVIRRESAAIDYTDLLGILVVAAAGAAPLDASDAQEEAVREILRFLTQVRWPAGPLEPVFVRSENVVPVLAVAQPVMAEPVVLPMRETHEAAAPVPRAAFAETEELEPQRRLSAGAWIAGGLALAVVLGCVWMLRPMSHTPESMAVVRSVPSAGLNVGEKDEAVAPTAKVRRGAEAATVRKASPVVERHPIRLQNRPVASTATQRPAPVRRLALPPVGPPVVAEKPSAPVARPMMAEAAPASRPLHAAAEGAASRSPEMSATVTSAPSVRRRLPKSVVINPGLMGRPEGWSRTASGPVPGLVHPASIGMMASNLISSPAPAYPAAASQARVQGEVTVRAVVDREGNVVDARVVSGPELLRGASLEAVQRWRYRPFMQGGKPVEVATTAVLDFELP